MIGLTNMFSPIRQGNNGFTEICKETPRPGMHLPIRGGIRDPKSELNIFNIAKGCDTPDTGGISGMMNRRPDDSLVCYLA